MLLAHNKFNQVVITTPRLLLHFQLSDQFTLLSQNEVEQATHCSSTFSALQLHAVPVEQGEAEKTEEPPPAANSPASLQHLSPHKQKPVPPPNTIAPSANYIPLSQIHNPQSLVLSLSSSPTSPNISYPAPQNYPFFTTIKNNPTNFCSQRIL